MSVLYISIIELFIIVSLSRYRILLVSGNKSGRSILNQAGIVTHPDSGKFEKIFANRSINPDALNIDIATISANLAGIPGMSIPAGFDKDGMPIGLQILAPQLAETKLFNAAHKFERANDFYTKLADI